MYDTVNLVRVTSIDKNVVDERAQKFGIKLTSKHWEAINFLKNFYDYHEDEKLKVKDYNNALKGTYVKQGGLKYLHSVFPEDPVKTIKHLAGITPA